MASDRIEPLGTVLSCVHWSPPSVVCHRPSPNTNPIRGVANRIPHTTGALPIAGSPTGTTGAGRPTQLAPRFRVRAIEVHGACAHGAVPSTNASSGDTQVTDVAANPAGTEELDTERAVVRAAGPADPAAPGTCTEPHPAMAMAAAAASRPAQRIPPPPRR